MKNIYKSKTFIVNLIILILTIIELTTHEILNIFGFSPEDQKDILILAGSCVAVLNLILRMLTNQGVAIAFKPNLPIEPIELPIEPIEPIVVEPITDINKVILFVGFMLFSSASFADTTVILYDSAAEYHRIVNTVKFVIDATPTPNAAVAVVKGIIATVIGGATAFFIGLHLRRKRNKLKK